MTRDAIAKFHDTWSRPNNATRVIVGDTTPAEIKPQLEKAFASGKQGNTPKKSISNVAAPKQAEVYLIDKPGAAQSFILAGTIAPPRNSPQEIALGIWNDVLGGAFGGRGKMKPREDKHRSFGALTAVQFAAGDSACVTQA